MKRIAIISRHAVPNYGSLLQAYALQTALSKLEMNAFYIDAEFCYSDAKIIARTAMETSKWNNVPILNKISYVTKLKRYQKPIEMFRKYQEKWLQLSEKRYCEREELYSDYPEADIYMVGSDQVWNTMPDGNLEKTYFMDFLKRGERRISYAASFGPIENYLPCRDIIRSYLEMFDAITVREDNGLGVLQKLGLTGTQVLDPTLLLCQDEWSGLSNMKVELPDQYVLLYQVNHNKKICKYAEALAKRKGMKLIRISSDLSECFWGNGFFYLPVPNVFLRLFMKASFVVTDSFHGTCFCINFNKQFVDVLPEVYSHRNQSVLKLTGLADRIVTYDNYDKIDDMINWTSVNEIIQKERERSMEILGRIISSKI